MPKVRNSHVCTKAVAVLYFTCVSVMSSLAVGETIYRSVDAKGNVTYSSAPAAESVNTRTIAVPQGPTDEQRQEAEEIQQQIENAADRQRQDLATVRGQRTGSVQQAEKTLADAKADLENAQVVQDSDWQHLGGGGRHLKESYFQRVQQAEDRVRSAEQKLKSSRLGPR